MEVIETDRNGYREVFSSTYHVFNSVDFNVLNEARCDQLLFLFFRDTKIRLGLIAGVKSKELHSPFSAPFGGFSFSKNDITIVQIEKAVDALLKYAADKGYQHIH